MYNANASDPRGVPERLAARAIAPDFLGSHLPNTSGRMTSAQLRTGVAVAIAACLAASQFLWHRSWDTDALDPFRRTQTGEAIPSFELRDAFGNLYSSERLLAEHRLCLFIFHGCECPLVRQYADRLERLHREYRDHGVAVLGINSNAQDSPTKIARFVRETGVTFPILKDPGSRVADLLSATRTPEALLVSNRGHVIYRGRIDDQYGVGYRRPAIANAYVEEAIEAWLAQKPIPNASNEPVGCLIGRIRGVNDGQASASSTTITYTQHISALLSRRCVECHREGEVAPFPLVDYEDVLGWAPMIREVVETGRMPPWGADPSAGEFRNDPRLTEQELAELFAWIDNGSPRGSGPAAPLPRFPEGWRIPEPDDVYYISEGEVPVEATGPIPYKTFFVPLPYWEDKWVKAAELRPGNRRVVHHANAWVLGPDEPDDDYSRPPTFTFAPGTPPLTCPTGYAVRIPARARLRMQLHYEPIGTPAVDRTALGLVFTDAKSVRGQIVFDSVLPSRPLRIAAGDGEARSDGSVYFAREAKLLAFLPHLHLRGKSFRFDLVRPGSPPETVLYVPRYDFNWQLLYYLKEPLSVAPGSELRCSAVFDNSAENPNNPDPDRTVPWGPETTDEMMVGYLIGVDPRSEGAASSQYVFPMEGFGAPLDRDWSVIDDGGGHARIVASTDPEGRVHIQQTPSSATASEPTCVGRRVVPVFSGRTYTFSFRAKASSAGGVRVCVLDPSTGQSLGLNESIAVGSQWSYHRYEVMATSSASDPIVTFTLDPSLLDVELAQVTFLQGSHR